MSFRETLAMALTTDPARRAALRLAAQRKALTINGMVETSPLIRAQSAYIRQLQAGQLLAQQHRRRPLPPTWDAARAVDEYRRSVYIFRMLRSMVKAVASVPWTVSRRREATRRSPSQWSRPIRRPRRPEDEWEKIEGHPLSQLFDKPNPSMSRRDFFEMVIQQRWLTGVSLTYIGDLTGELPPPIAQYGALARPFQGYGGKSNLLQFPLDPDAPLARGKGDIELWPLATAGFSPMTDENGELSHFHFDHSAIQADFPAESMIQVKFADPSNPFWGISPLESIARQLDMDREALEWNTNMLQRGSGLSGQLKYTGGLLQGDDYAEARALVDAELAGYEHAGDILVTGNDWTMQDFNRSMRDMDWVRMREQAREEVLSSGGMPPPTAGFYNNATLANVEAGRKGWWLDEVLPDLDDLRTTFERRLLPLYQEQGEELWLRYDTSGVSALREDLAAKIGNFQRLLESGVSFNEAKAVVELDLDDIEGYGDEPFGLQALKRLADTGGAIPPSGTVGDGNAATPDTRVAVPLRAVESEAEDEEWSVQPSRRPVQGAGKTRKGGEGLTAAGYRIKLYRRADPETKQGGGAALAFEAVIPTIESMTADYEARIHDRFLDVVTEARSNVDLSLLADAIRAGATTQVLDLLGLDELEQGLASLVEDFELASAEAGDAVVGELPTESSFDLSRATLSALLRIRTLAKDLVATNREGVLQAMVAWNGGRLGDDAELAARAFAAMPGLNEGQASQVVELWASLIKWNDDRGEYQGQETAAKKAERLASGLVEDRASLIGQVEAAAAINGGQLEAWRQMEREGLVRDVRKQWVTSPGSPDVCPICISLDEQEVEIGDRFHSDYSKTDYDQPTAHPNCYCGLLVTAELVGGEGEEVEGEVAQ